MISLFKHIAISLIFSSCLLHAGIEKWTRSADGVTISAELVGYDTKTNKVTLKLPNGKKAVIDGDILVPENQQRLAKHAKEIAAMREAAKFGRLESIGVGESGSYKIHIYRPAGYIEGDQANASRPVVFVYAPGGESMWILNLLKAGADELGWVAVGVDAYSNKRLRANQHAQVIEDTKAAYKTAVEHVAFDDKKVVFCGFSGGGYWSYQSASWLKNDTAGIVSIGGGMGMDYNKKYSSKMAVAIVNGLDDKNANARIAEDSACLEKRNMATVKVFTYPGAHRIPKPEVTLEAMRWIHETKDF